MTDGRTSPSTSTCAQLAQFARTEHNNCSLPCNYITRLAVTVAAAVPRANLGTQHSSMPSFTSFNGADEN